MLFYRKGSLHLILDGRRIPLNSEHENLAMAGLMLNACGVSTLSSAAQAAIQRLQVEAAGKTGKMRLRRFAALSSDHKRLYIPLEGEKLLRIT